MGIQQFAIQQATHRTAREARKQTKLLELIATQARAVPAGWYHAQGDPAGSVRYWDARQWTQGFKP